MRRRVFFNGDKVVVKGGEISLEGDSKRCHDDREHTSRKRVKAFNSFHNKELEVKLKKLSGDMSVLRETKLTQVSVSRKRDDAPVPIELWLFWLNVGIKDGIYFDEWDKYVVIIQEKLLLVKWKRNLMRSWSSWFRAKCVGKKSEVVIKGNEVVEMRPRVWKWVKGGLKRYKINAFVRVSYPKDREAGRDCIIRAVGST